MSRRVSIGMVVMILLLSLALAGVSGQPTGRPSGSPADQASPEPTRQPADPPSDQPADRPTAPMPSNEEAPSKDFSSPASRSPSDSGSSPASAGSTGSASFRSPGSVPTSPQDQFSSWLASSSEGRRYAGVAHQIEDIAQRIGRAGIPLEVIKARMREGQAKRVGAEVFAEALILDANHWIRVASLLGDARWPPASKAPDFYIAASTALRNGVDDAAISTLIAWALTSRGTPERAGAVLISISSLTGLMNSVQLSRIAGLMAVSRLRVGDFDDLAAALQRAAAGGRSASDLLTVLEEVLGNRGTLRTLERRLVP